MSRTDVKQLLISWGWVSSGDYAVAIGYYRINLEAIPKNHGFAVKTNNPSDQLWVTEADLKHNIAVKFFLQNLAHYHSKN